MHHHHHHHSNLRYAVDAAQNPERAVRRFTSGCIFSIVLSLVGLCVAAGVGVYVVWVSGRAIANAPVPAAVASGEATWSGSGTFECGAAQNLTLSGMTVTMTTGPAIRASGACHLTLINMTISAPTVIESAGSAVVTLQGGTLTGSQSAIEASGGSQVVVNGATVTGTVHRNGGASITGIPVTP